VYNTETGEFEEFVRPRNGKKKYRVRKHRTNFDKNKFKE